MPGVGSLFDCLYGCIMERRDRPQKADFGQSGDYWFKSFLGLCGQGILSVSYDLRGILKKNLYGEWCRVLMGLRCPKPEDLSEEDQGAGFGSEGWPRVRVPFGCKELMWDLRMGGL